MKEMEKILTDFINEYKEVKFLAKVSAKNRYFRGNTLEFELGNYDIDCEFSHYFTILHLYGTLYKMMDRDNILFVKEVVQGFEHFLYRLILQFQKADKYREAIWVFNEYAKWYILDTDIVDCYLIQAFTYKYDNIEPLINYISQGVGSEDFWTIFKVWFESYLVCKGRDKEDFKKLLKMFSEKELDMNYAKYMMARYMAYNF